MNKRIKELAEQAGINLERDGVTYWIDNVNLKMFAKFIIAECVYIATKTDKQTDIALEIKEFFK